MTVRARIIRREELASTHSACPSAASAQSPASASSTTPAPSTTRRGEPIAPEERTSVRAGGDENLSGKFSSASRWPGTSPRGRVLKKPVADAFLEAASILDEARAQAEAIVAEAQRRVESLQRDALAQAREQMQSELAAAWLNVRREDAANDERALDRSIDLARVIAERLLDESLALEPSRILALARQALATVRQAREIVVLAHPDDAKVLSAEIEAWAPNAAVVRVEVESDRPRGSLLFRTNLGTIDGDLSLQLDRLTAALRKGLGS